MTKHKNRVHLKLFKYECPHCQYKTYSKKNLNDHINKIHLKTESMKCGLCDYTTLSKIALKGHINYNHRPRKPKKHQCPLCDFAHDDLARLDDHVNMQHTRETEHKCPECYFSSYSKATIANHIKDNHDANVECFQCEFCDYSAKRWTPFGAHNIKVHKKLKIMCNCGFKCILYSRLEDHQREKECNVLGDIYCSLCPFQTSKKNVFKAHVKEEHTLGPKDELKCDICEYKTFEKSHMKKHFEVIHLGIAPPKKYKCQNCPYATDNSEQLKGHVESKHEKSQKYKCDICDEVMNSRIVWRNHKKRMHSRGFLKCEICEFQTRYAVSLKNHVNSQHEQSHKFTCNVCQKACFQESNFRTHMKVHASEKKFKCTLCEFSTNQKVSMKSHINVNHTRNDLLRCTFETCEFTTFSYSYFERHCAEHKAKTKIHKCDFCDFTSKHHRYCVKHTVATHLKDFSGCNFKCQYCQFKAKSNATVMRHTRLYHNSIQVSKEEQSEATDEGNNSTPKQMTQLTHDQCPTPKSNVKAETRLKQLTLKQFMSSKPKSEC